MLSNDTLNESSCPLRLGIEAFLFWTLPCDREEQMLSNGTLNESSRPPLSIATGGQFIACGMCPLLVEMCPLFVECLHCFWLGSLLLVERACCLWNVS